MLRGLSRLESHDSVLFLNATDRFVGSSSVQLVMETLERLAKEKTEFFWGLGKTAVIDAGRPHFLRLSPRSEITLRMLRTGSIGLPHPSMVCRVGALRDVDAFAGRWKVSHDYKVGLALGEKFGPPTPLWFPLSYYDQHGDSSNHPIATYVSKLKVRMSYAGIAGAVKEPIAVGWVLIRGILRALGRFSFGFGMFGLFGWERFHISPNSHFCSHSDDSLWPHCCDSVLS
jgi:hypothetical protein